MARTNAPNIRIAVSEEAKANIAERTDAGGPCGYDIWIAHMPTYAKDYAWARERDHGEHSWFYSLPQDAMPYFNPCRNDVGLEEGMHHRVLTWVSWTYRIKGWAYYLMSIFFNGNRPKVGAELFRETFEDYEYLYKANGNKHPVVYQTIDLDATAASIGMSTTTWSQVPAEVRVIRHELARFITGQRSTVPVLTVSTPPPMVAAYINFQDPAGAPTANPLVVNSKTWQKIGWGAFDAVLGYGWSGPFIGNAVIMKYAVTHLVLYRGSFSTVSL